MIRLLTFLCCLFCSLAQAQTITPAPIYGIWSTYIPTVTISGGTGTSATPTSASYILQGKLLIIQIQTLLTFTTAPSFVSFSLPTGTCITGAAVGTDTTSGAVLGALCSPTTALALTSFIGIASADHINLSGTVQLQ